ncbi:hypothetical protein JW949_00155 [Candidatus Woesearchaeota archaeon]|nr:hypothetical protein [Candidatus Woesearchaeota archaeon]
MISLENILGWGTLLLFFSGCSPGKPIDKGYIVDKRIVCDTITNDTLCSITISNRAEENIIIISKGRYNKVNLGGYFDGTKMPYTEVDDDVFRKRFMNQKVY